MRNRERGQIEREERKGGKVRYYLTSIALNGVVDVLDRRESMQKWQPHYASWAGIGEESIHELRYRNFLTLKDTHLYIPYTVNFSDTQSHELRPSTYKEEGRQFIESFTWLKLLHRVRLNSDKEEGCCGLP